jgi:hypothetical protein
MRFTRTIGTPATRTRQPKQLKLAGTVWQMTEASEISRLVQPVKPLEL